MNPPCLALAGLFHTLFLLLSCVKYVVALLHSLVLEYLCFVLVCFGEPVRSVSGARVVVEYLDSALLVERLQ